MKLRTKDIDNRYSDERKRELIRDAENLNPDFVAIVQAELDRGNLISEVSTGWPNVGSVVIGFKWALLKDHPRPRGIYFEIPNNVKGWKYQYSNYNYTNENVVHMLISGDNNA